MKTRRNPTARILAAGFVLALWHACAAAAITFVQTSGKFNTTNGQTIQSSSLGTNPVVGNTIIILAWSWNNSTAPTLSASDNKGNTYTSVAQGSLNGGSAGYQNAAVLMAPVTATGGSFRVSVTSAPSNSQIEAVALEYSGIAQSGAVDQTGTNTGTSSTATVSTSGTTTTANELVSSAMSILSPSTSFSISPASGYTDRATQTQNNGSAAGEGSDEIVAATGVQSNTWTTNPAMTGWVAAIATFRGAVTVSAANSTVTANPTSVAADNSTTSTISVTLKDGSNNPVAGKTVTLASNSGTSIVTTISGTTSASGVATFTVQDGAPEMVTYTATDATDHIVVTQTAQVTFTATTCYNDNFPGSGTPAGYWSTGTESGGFSPTLLNNRLRLTDTGGDESTWVTLNKYFPGAGNKITVEFNHFAYGGSGGTGGANTGADGVAVILSDASVAPSAGAFGGSLGYAQKSNPGSDCSVPGGCVGFAGGWMGTGIDEYGNFQNPTEGRYGGPGLVTESVSIRGSGSGMSGYRYIAGTSTLSPGVDNNGTAIPPYRYRITVDHSDSIHAWVSVERDTTGGGTAYQTILGATGCSAAVTAGCLDINNAIYSQNPVPTNWRLSFTGASGGATNTHEVAVLKVCSGQNIVTPTLDHLAIFQPTSACTGSSNPATITVKACADTACSSLYTGSVTATLSVSGGHAIWSPGSPITFTNGQAILTLTDNTAESVTLGATATSPAAGNATVCYNSAGSVVSCTNALTFGKCYFDAVETSDSNPPGPIYTKLTGTSFNLSIWNISGSTQTVTQVEIVDANTGTPGSCSSYNSLASTTGSWRIWNNNSQRLAFTYSSAVRNARIRITAGANVSCSSDNFSIRPTQLTLSSTASQAGTSGTPTIKAGSGTFSITATGGAGYDGTPKFNLSDPGIITGTSVMGALGAATFPAASGGAATASGLTYSEVGGINLAADAVYDDGFTAVDSTKANPECTSDFSNTNNANGMYGCMFGSPSATFGRFVPDHFQTALTKGCVAGSFTYSGQPFSAVITAQNSASVATQNYTGSYAKTVTLSDGGTGAVPCSSNCTVQTTSFSAGVATLTSSQPKFTFSSVTTSPKTLLLRATDTDSISSAGFTEGSTQLYSGRLRLFSAYGSNLLPATVPLRAEYYTGGSWSPNASDSCSAIAQNSVSLGGGISSNLCFLANPRPSAPTIANCQAGGSPALTLAKGIGNLFVFDKTAATGSVSVALNLGSATSADASCNSTHPSSAASNVPWLQYAWCSGALDPNAGLKFGSPKAPYIYLRERY